MKLNFGFTNPYLRKRVSKKFIFHLFYKFHRPWVPLYIYLVIANKCNLKCKQCDIWKEEFPTEDELSLEEVKHILLDIKKWLGRFYLSISGGEPFLRKERVLKITKFASSNDINVSTVSNGTLITPQLAEEIIEAGFSELIISLDSLNPSIHNYIRGTTFAYKKTIEGIENLIDARNRYNSSLKITIHTILMQVNLDSIINLVRWCKDKNVLWAFQLLSPKIAFGGRKFNKNWFEEEEFFIKDMDKLKRVLKILKILKKKGYPIANPYYEIDLALKYYFFPQVIKKEKCATAFKNLIIDPWGGVKLCFILPPIGNIRENNIQYIWKYSPQARAQRKLLLRCPLPCKYLQCNRYDYTLLRLFKELL